MLEYSIQTIEKEELKKGIEILVGILTELLIVQNACLPIANPYHFYSLCQTVSPKYQLAGSSIENLICSIFKRENDWYNCMYERSKFYFDSCYCCENSVSSLWCWYDPLSSLNNRKSLN